MFQRLSIVAAAAVVAGCASITQGTSQTIVFSVQPADARCIVTRDKDGVLGTITRSQRTISLSKGAGDLTVQCTADGYEPYVQRVRSSTQTEGVVSFFFLDLGITDMITGAMWAYPSHVSIGLERSDAPSEPRNTRAATNKPVAGDPEPVSTVVGAESRPAKRDEPRIGPDSGTIRKMPEAQQCHPDPVATLVGTWLSSLSTYSVTCKDGTTLLARCEFGNCRVLR